MNRIDNCSRYLISMITGIPEDKVTPEMYQSVTELVAGYLASQGCPLQIPIQIVTEGEIA